MWTLTLIIHANFSLLQAWIAGQNMLSQTLLPSSKHILLPGEDYLSLYRHSQQLTIAILSAVENWRKKSELPA